MVLQSSTDLANSEFVVRTNNEFVQTTNSQWLKLLLSTPAGGADTEANHCAVQKLDSVATHTCAIGNSSKDTGTERPAAQRLYRWRLKLKYRCRMPRSKVHLYPFLWLYSHSLLTTRKAMSSYGGPAWSRSKQVDPCSSA